MDSLSPTQLAGCGLILIAAYGLRGSTGFGTTAAMPLLALFVPVKILIPVWTVLGIASSLVVLWREARHVSMGAMIRLLPSCLIGTGIGLFLFRAFVAGN